MQLGQALNASKHGQNSASSLHVNNGPDPSRQCSLMLILDVRTCWSSTHQMLHMLSLFSLCNRLIVNLFFIGRALDFSKEIDVFTGSNHDLRALELDPAEWEAIALVSNWLKTFRSATTEMSTTKKPMLSTVHAIFRGLQDHIKTILETLSDNVNPQLRDGLVAAHQKLSEYYYRSDASPYYTWAASEFYFFL